MFPFIVLMIVNVLILRRIFKNLNESTFGIQIILCKKVIEIKIIWYHIFFFFYTVYTIISARPLWHPNYMSLLINSLIYGQNKCYI